MGKPQPIHETVQAKYANYSSAPKKKTRKKTPIYANQSPHENIHFRSPYPPVPTKTKLTNKEVSHIKKRTRRAIRAGLVASYTLLWFYPVQLLFAFLFFIAYTAAKTEGFVAWMTRDIALAIMGVSWVIIIILGVSFLTYAIINFSISRIKLFSDSSLLIIFSFCLWGYIVPLLFFFPWVYLFIFFVIYKQKRVK